MENTPFCLLCISSKAFVTVGKIIDGKRPETWHAVQVFLACWDLEFYSEYQKRYIHPTVRFNTYWVWSTMPGYDRSAQCCLRFVAFWALQYSVLAAAFNHLSPLHQCFGGLAKKVSSHATSIGIIRVYISKQCLGPKHVSCLCWLRLFEALQAL